MNPISSSSLNPKDNCSPISSNCVIWQGPNIACINLCKDDRITTVVYKLAMELCALKDDIGLTDMDLSALVQVCQTTVEPAKTLSNILALLISKVVCLSDLVNNLQPSGDPYVEPTLNLPACLQYSDGQGGTITNLLHRQYTLRLATVLCTINSTVNTHTSQIAANTQDILDLQNEDHSLPTMIPACVLSGTQAIDDVLVAVEQQFCQLRTALGTPIALSTAAGKQCENLNSSMSLSQSWTMPGFAGWQATVTNFAQSVQNLWITVCDIRGAVKAIQDNCCRIDCDSIRIDFDSKMIDAGTIRLFFLPKGNLPVGFHDCDETLGTKFTITDVNGSEYITYIKLRESFDDTNVLVDGYDIDISNSALDPVGGLVITSNACITNDTTTCIKCVSINVPAFKTGCCVITASDKVSITYQICPQLSTTTTTLPA